MSSLRQHIQEVEEAVAEAKEQVRNLSDEEFVRQGAVVLQEMMDANHRAYLYGRVWRVWLFESYDRDLASDILDAKAENEGR